MVAVKEEISSFARMVDKLRLMNDAELKLAYNKLFEDEIAAKWKVLMEEMNFTDVSDEMITTAFFNQRYPSIT
jgi:hypothetical protein